MLSGCEHSLLDRPDISAIAPERSRNTGGPGFAETFAYNFAPYPCNQRPTSGVDSGMGTVPGSPTPKEMRMNVKFALTGLIVAALSAPAFAQSTPDTKSTPRI